MFKECHPQVTLKQAWAEFKKKKKIKWLLDAILLLLLFKWAELQNCVVALS